MFHINDMPIFYMQTRPQNPKFTEAQKHKESPRGGLRPPPQRGGPPPAVHPFVGICIFLCFCEFGVWGSSLHIKNRHIISGKHAQELYADFEMPLRPLIIPDSLALRGRTVYNKMKDFP